MTWFDLNLKRMFEVYPNTLVHVLQVIIWVSVLANQARNPYPYSYPGPRHTSSHTEDRLPTLAVFSLGTGLLTTCSERTFLGRPKLDEKLINIPAQTQLVCNNFQTISASWLVISIWYEMPDYSHANILDLYRVADSYHLILLTFHGQFKSHLDSSKLIQYHSNLSKAVQTQLDSFTLIKLHWAPWKYIMRTFRKMTHSAKMRMMRTKMMMMMRSEFLERSVSSRRLESSQVDFVRLDFKSSRVVFFPTRLDFKNICKRTEYHGSWFRVNSLISLKIFCANSLQCCLKVGKHIIVWKSTILKTW